MKVRRRKLLLICAGTVPATAGCMGDDESDTGDGEDTESDDSPTGDDSESDGSSDSDSDVDPDDVDRTIEVEGWSFGWDPSEIEVARGEAIELVVSVEDDGIGDGHGLAIPAFDVGIAPIYPDQSESAVFVADEVGEFQMLCSVQCSQPGAGTGHEQMIGSFTVTE